MKKARSNQLNRVISWMLAICMVFTMVQMPTLTFAEETTGKTKEVYLSDVEWTSATNANGIEGESQTPHKDSNHEGQDIQLMVDGVARSFTKGIGAHADSTIVYDLTGKGYTHFSTYAGVDYSRLNDYNNNNNLEGVVTFKATIDDSVILEETTLNPTSNAVLIDVDIPEGAKTLTLTLTTGEQSWSDWANWADAKFTIAYPDAENVALNKTVSVKKAADDSAQNINPDMPAVNMVDGVIPDVASGPTNYCDFGTDNNDESSYVEIDLGEVYEIDQINLWRYWDTRSYKGTVIRTSTSASFAEATTVYNSDAENFHGFGIGTDATYVETKAGKEIPFAGHDARYVRIYMHGSTNGNTIGTTNHVVEVQVMGYNFGPKPYIADAFENANAYIDLPTHYQDKQSAQNEDGSLKFIGGQVTHPDVVYVAEGWNGYEYWMVYTPNVSSTSQYENPYIAASHDGTTWVEPEGIKNPIEPEPISKRFHNCDADMIYNPEMDAMMAYWNWADDDGDQGAAVRVRISYDGVNWGVPSTYDEATGIWTKPANDSERTLKAATVDSNNIDNSFITSIASKDRYDMLSPTFTYDSHRKLFVMWANNAKNVGYENGQANYVETRYSTDGLTWGTPTKVNNFLSTNEANQQLAPWHQDISYVPELKEYWGISQCFSGKNPDGSALFMTKSKDGINWEQVGHKAILGPGEAGSWDDFQIYRTSFMYDAAGAENPEDGTIRLWYAALQNVPADRMVINSAGEKVIKMGTNDGRIWRIGYTANSYLEVMKALTQDEYYEEPAVVEGTSLILKPENRTILPGTTTKLTNIFTPADTTDQLVKYESEDKSIATVDALGVVTAKALGSVYITGTTRSGLSGKVKITVGETAEGGLRRVVNNENPLLVMPLYGKSYSATDGGVLDWGDTLVERWASVPDDIKDYAIIELHLGGKIGLNESDSHTAKAFYEEQLAIAEANDIPIMMVVATAGQKNYWTGCANLDDAWIDSMFEQFSCLKGIMSTENYWTDYNAVANRGKGYLETAAKHGGFFMWSEHQTNVIESVIANASFNEALQQYSENFIFTWKNTPAGQNKNPGTASHMQGLWLSDMVGQWGGLMDTWKWYELGYWKLFAGSCNGYNPGGEEARPVATEPEALLGIEMLGIYNNGGCVYNFEHPAYVYGSYNQTSPCFNNVILETFRYIMANPAPSKQEVIDSTKAIVYGNTSSFGASNFYNGLNCADGTTGTYSSGRYDLIPTVPASVPKSLIQKNFSDDKIINSNDDRISTVEKRKAFFDSLYEEEYTGTGFAQKVGDTYVIYNSMTNTNVDQNVTIPLSEETSVDFEMTPHTFAFVDKKSGGLDVYLNNYRVDKDSIWEGYKETVFDRWDTDHNTKLQDWVRDSYIPNPEDDAMRDTVITLNNVAAKPVVTYARQLENQVEEPVITYDTKTKIATITLATNGYVDFSIQYDEADITPVESVELDKTEVALKVGETETIKATVNPTDATDNTITWTTDKESVATVVGGKITAVGVGTAKITATAGGKSATCTVTVSKADVAVESVTLSKTAVALKVGATETIKATVNPTDATDNTVTWTTDKASIATVVGGKITAVGVGTAKITAEAGGKSATCTVTVSKADVAVESVTLSKTAVALKVGATETIKATVNPTDAKDNTVTWKSEKESVATVVGGKITAVAEGTAKITATAGGKTATCTVTVSKADETNVPVESVTLSKKAVALKVGATETIKATVNPTDATDNKVTWTTDKASVATVEGGKITAVGVGTAKITAEAGGKTATCTVTVSKVEEHPTNGWYQDKTNNKWKYYKNNIALRNKWVQVDQVWYYMGNDEYMTTKWQFIDGKWYYLGTNGKMATKWKIIDKAWYYFNQSGAMVTKWQKIDKTWYYFNKSGKMKTNWYKEGNTWYYLKSSGAMATGWNKIGGSWYFMNTSGKMQTGWVKSKGLWYFMKESGKMATGWIKVGRTYYYLNASGAWTGQTHR